MEPGLDFLSPEGYFNFVLKFNDPLQHLKEATATASRKVCHKVSTGLRMLMCLTSALFHRKRSKIVKMII